MVHIAPCFQQLWPFVYENSPFKTMSALSKSNSFDQNFMKLVTLLSTMMSSSSLIMVYMAPCFKKFLPLVYEISSVEMTSDL